MKIYTLIVILLLTNYTYGMESEDLFDQQSKVLARDEVKTDGGSAVQTASMAEIARRNLFARLNHRPKEEFLRLNIKDSMGEDNEWNYTDYFKPANSNYSYYLFKCPTNPKDAQEKAFNALQPFGILGLTGNSQDEAAVSFTSDDEARWLYMFVRTDLFERFVQFNNKNNGLKIPGIIIELE